MPYLVLFQHPHAQEESGVGFTTEEDRDHDAYMKQLESQGLIHSRKDQNRADPDMEGLNGYILLCSTHEEAEAIARKDPMWSVAKGQLITWTLDELGEGSKSERDVAERRALGFDPIFPITTMERSLTHYQALGFKTETYDNKYAFATLPDLGCIHLTVQSDHDPKVNAAATYLHVEDADALAAKWKRDCPEGDTREVVDTDYGLREGAHLDPDNNLIRFGSKMSTTKTDE